MSGLVLSAGASWAQNCSSFQNCAQAVASYKAGNGKLDRDKEGIPCEKLCGSNGKICPDNARLEADWRSPGAGFMHNLQSRLC